MSATETRASDDGGDDARRRFVLELGRAMHALGSPAYRVEDAMDVSARSLGLQGSYFATPTAIFAAIGPSYSPPTTVLLRVQPGNNDLGKLSQLYAVRDEVVSGRVSAADGLERVAAVLAMPSTHGPLTQLPALGVVAAMAAVFLGGGAREVLVALCVGLGVGLLAWGAATRQRFVNVLEPTACALASFAVAGAARVLDLDPGIATLASIVSLLPGLTFTTALAELAMRHLASGSARLLGAGAVTVTMAVGVGLGSRLGVLVFGAVASPPLAPLSPVWEIPAVFVAAPAYVVLLRARWADLPAVLAAVLIAFGGARLGGLLFERELAAFGGALAVTLAANLYSRWFRLPAGVLRTPGLLMLVPGSLGFRGLTTALQQDFGAGAQFALQMVLVGGSLVAGMLLASVVLPPPLDVEGEAGP